MNFSAPITKVLSQVYADKVSITEDGLKQMNIFLNKIASIMVSTTAELVTVKPTNESIEMLSNPKPVDKKTVEAAAKLLLPQELASYVIEEAERATSKSVVFPTNIISNLLNSKTIKVKKGAEVYFASILETISEELIEFGGEAANQNGSSVISPRWLKLVITYEPPYKQLAETVNFDFM